MKQIVLLIMLLLSAGTLTCAARKGRAQQVIAHRGYWKTEGSAQNSLSSLRNTYRIGVYGSEFDVHITRDGEVVVFHDDDIDGLRLEDATLAQLREKRLANGELIPTLQEYLQAAKSLGTMKLILEVKEHTKKTDEDRCVDAVLRLVSEAGLEGRTEYISFSKHACDYLVNKDAKLKVLYLNGDLSPEEAKAAGYAGIDYEDAVFDAHSEWINQAHKLGLITNVWTVDDLDAVQRFFNAGIDFVTTNEPLKAKALK